MSKNNLIQIGGELFNSVGDGIIADSAAVKDYTKNKTQQTINSELTASVENISRSVPSSGNVVKIESQQGNSVLVLKNEDGTEVSTIVGAADRYSGWEQGGDTRIPTIGLVKEKLTAIVDTALSTTSENAVQNKVVTNALTGKQATISDLSTIRSGAAAGATAVQPAAMNTALEAKQDTISDLSTIRSGAAAGATAVQPATMNTALAAKQDTLTFDNTPTANSNNPVKSGGVKTAIDAKQDTISTVNVTVDNNTGTPSGTASVSGGTLTLNFSNLKGATGATGPQGIQGVQGVQGPKGDTGVSGDASSLAIIHGIDKTTTYQVTDVCGADAAQTLLNLIEGGFYY